MKVGALLLLLAAQGQAAATVDAHVQNVTALIAAHRAAVARLAAPAKASAQALLAGGGFYVCCGENAWNNEANTRAGGPMRLTAIPSIAAAKPRDVVWIAYTRPAGLSYDAAVAIASQAAKGVVVVVFGPKPATADPPFPNWVDSLAPAEAAEDLTLLGNVLSLWSLTGEVAAETARTGRTLAFWESVWVPGADKRNAHYANAMFHHGPPKMERIAPGVLSAAYLDYVGVMVKRIAEAELPKILDIAKTIDERAAAGTPSTLVTMSHLVRGAAAAGTPKWKLAPDAKSLTSNGYFVYLGYYGVDLELWRDVRAAETNAAWIVSPIARQTDFSSYGDLLVDQHWDFGDGAVAAPGYDVPILPPSGVAQLFIYQLLARAVH